LQVRSLIPDLEITIDRVRETNDRLVNAARKATNSYLDRIEKYGADFAQAECKIAKQSQIDIFAGLLDTHAKLTENFVNASVSAARELIAA
jgi:hypothetical protein